MGSEELWIECKSCGKKIQKTSKNCSECGTKIKKNNAWKWIGGAFLALMIIGSFSTEENSKASKRVPSAAKEFSQNALPKVQNQFITTVGKYSSSFSEAKNELQQSLLRDNRKTEISTTLSSLRVKGWIGTISSLETNSEGKAILSLKISPDIRIKTWNNALSDINSYTLIEKSSSLYKTLLNLSQGQKVVFSGTFFPSKDDYVREGSLTISGSMTSPEYIFKFKSLKAIK